MKKLMVVMNVISLVFFISILSKVNIPFSSITGFATAVSSATFDFQPSLILAFLFIFVTTVLNVYFFLLKSKK